MGSSCDMVWLAIVPLLLSVWVTHSARADTRAWVGRLVFTAYWILMTILLLAPNPMALFGFRPLLSHVSGRGVHFAFFTVLALLAWACRFRVRRSILILSLVAYGLTVESLQALIPPRSVELLDYGENLLGVFTGSVLWWGWQAVCARKCPAGTSGEAFDKAAALHAEVERVDSQSP